MAIIIIPQRFAICSLAIDNPSMTPSASMLDEMQRNNETYFRMAMRKAQEHRDSFKGHPLDQAVTAHYAELAQQSLVQQAAKEANDQISFDQFLFEYWQSS